MSECIANILFVVLMLDEGTGTLVVDGVDLETVETVGGNGTAADFSAFKDGKHELVLAFEAPSTMDEMKYHVWNSDKGKNICSGFDVGRLNCFNPKVQPIIDMRSLTAFPRIIFYNEKGSFVDKFVGMKKVCDFLNVSNIDRFWPKVWGSLPPSLRLRETYTPLGLRQIGDSLNVSYRHARDFDNAYNEAVFICQRTDRRVLLLAVNRNATADQKSQALISHHRYGNGIYNGSFHHIIGKKVSQFSIG